jgi:glutaconate CoA-transferase subunit B
MAEAHEQELSGPEIMAVALSRAFVDGDFGVIGAAADVPMAALRLANETHAPNLTWLCGGSGAVRPMVSRLPQSTSDYRNLVAGEATYSLEDVVDWELNGRLDFACMGGMQIDKYGNTNLAWVDAGGGRRIRGPGSVGLVFMSALRKVYLYTGHHTARTLVDKVDFISGAGHLAGGGSRYEHLSRETQGPVLLVTPLAVFDFPEEHGYHMRLVSVSPGYEPEQVVEAMAFRPVIGDEVATTPPPTAEQLSLLRNVVDPDGRLRA